MVEAVAMAGSDFLDALEGTTKAKRHGRFGNNI